MSTKDLGTYEMLWNCPACGTEKLLGKTHRYCPNCGSPQDPASRYFPTEQDAVAVKDHVYTGVDWQCSGCDTPNSSVAEFCISCGSPKSGDKKVNLVGEDEKTEKAPSAPTAKKGGSKLALGCGLLVIVAVLGGITLLVASLLMKKEVDLTVSGHSWTRTIEIEEIQAKSESSWCDETPQNAYSITKTKEKRSEDQVADGEICTKKNKDQGDGTFKQIEECKTKYKSVPVYDEKCHYKINKWDTLKVLENKGSALTPAPSWPNLPSLKSGNSLGSQKKGDSAEHYYVHFKGEKAYSCDFSESTWASYKVGAKVKGKVGLTGLDCKSLTK